MMMMMMKKKKERKIVILLGKEHHKERQRVIEFITKRRTWSSGSLEVLFIFLRCFVVLILSNRLVNELVLVNKDIQQAILFLFC